MFNLIPINAVMNLSFPGDLIKFLQRGTPIRNKCVLISPPYCVYTSSKDFH